MILHIDSSEEGLGAIVYQRCRNAALEEALEEAVKEAEDSPSIGAETEKQQRSKVSTMELPALQKLRSVYSLVCILCLTLVLLIFRFNGMSQLLALTSPMLQPSVLPTLSESPPAGDTVLKGQSAHLLRVNGSKALLISAYLEHRTTKKEVRVLAIMLRSEKVALQCHLRCLDQLQISKAVINIYTNHFRFRYGTAEVLCPLPSGCKTPTHVAITSTAMKKEGLVEVIPWSLSKYLNVSRRAYPAQSPGDIHYFGQIPALNDCLYRYMYRSKYVALHDFDELILPQSVDSWVKLLPLLEKKYGAQRCYKFENNLFPTEFVLPPPQPVTLPPQDLWQNITGVNILSHLYREPFNPKFRRGNFKIITDPRNVFVASVHGVKKSNKSCSWVDRKMARMYHIKPRGKTNLKPEQLIYEGRLLSYSAVLTSAVNTVLGETGLLLHDGMN